MTIQFSTGLRNARADVIEALIGPSPILRLWSGSQPANLASTDTGVNLVSYVLSTDWLTDASSGTVTFNDAPIAGTASSSGDASYYRMYGPLGSTPYFQGSVGLSSDSPNLIIDVVQVINGQSINIISWSMTEGNQ